MDGLNRLPCSAQIRRRNYGMFMVRWNGLAWVSLPLHPNGRRIKKRRLKSGGQAELRGREVAVNSGDIKKNAEG